MSKWSRLMMLGVAALVLTGFGLACNTTEGIGKDTKAAGQGIENAADANK